MTLEELFALFTSEDLADALFQAGLPLGGAKAERSARLVGLASSTPAVELLNMFNVEAIRAACSSVGIRPGRKSDMIAVLMAVLPEGATVAAPPPPELLPPTRDAVLGCLQRLDIPRRKARTEADAEEAIAVALGPMFASVANQFSVGGYLGHRIDLDIGNGQVGIEVKLADSLQKSTGEIHRLIGQSVYYSRKRYGDNLIVVVVGQRGDGEDPLFAEMAAFLSDLGITTLFLPAT